MGKRRVEQAARTVPLDLRDRAVTSNARVRGGTQGYVWVIEPHALAASAIVAVLSPPWKTIVFGRASEALQGQHPTPDAALVDLETLHVPPAGFLSALVQRMNGAPVVALGGRWPSTLESRLLEVGLKGFVRFEELRCLPRVLSDVAVGKLVFTDDALKLFAHRASGWSRSRQVQPVLSRKEVKVIERIRNGLSNKEIADVEGLSERTVRFHVRNIFQKLGVSQRSELTLECGRHLLPDATIKI